MAIWAPSQYYTFQKSGPRWSRPKLYKHPTALRNQKNPRPHALETIMCSTQGGTSRWAQNKQPVAGEGGNRTQWAQPPSPDQSPTGTVQSRVPAQSKPPQPQIDSRAELPKSLAARPKPPHVLAPHREASHPAQNKTPYHPTLNPACYVCVRVDERLCSFCSCQMTTDQRLHTSGLLQ